MPEYTIPFNDRFIQYTATAGQTVFPYDFPIFDQSHLAVYKNGTLLTITTHYTVSGVDTQSGGNVTLTSGAALNDVITIRGDTPEQRVTDFNQAGDFLAATLNRELDLMTQQIQQLRTDSGRSIKFTDDSSQTGKFIEDLEANKMLLVNSAGTKIVMSDDNFTNIQADLAALGPIASDISTVAGIDSDVTAVAGNSTNINTVATNIANVNATGGSISNVNAVAGNATNINTVAGNNSNITTVAGISGNVTTVAGNTSNINTVASANTNISTVATNIASVNTAASNIADIIAAPAAAAGLSAVANKWTYSTTTTMADPTTGFIRFNNATLASVTAIAISELTGDTGNPNIGAFMATWDDSTNTTKGYVQIRKSGAPATYAVFALTALADNTNWQQFTVSHVASNGTFSNNDVIYLTFYRAGDKGADGAGSGTVTTTGTPANGNLTGFSGSTSITNVNLSGDVTTSGTLATTIANNAVTTAKIADGNVTAAKLANADFGDFTVSAGVATIDNNAITTAKIADNNVTLAKLATQAANTILANATGSTAVPTAVALSTNQVLGRLGGNLVAIDIGTTADNLVKLDGSARLPAVDGSQLTNLPAGLPTATSATVSGSAITLTVDFTTYEEYELTLDSVYSSAGGGFTIEMSSNGGSSYVASTYFKWSSVGNTPTNSFSTADIISNTNSSDVGGNTSGVIKIRQPVTSAKATINSTIIARGNGGTTREAAIALVDCALTAAANRVRLNLSSGSFSGGTYTIAPTKKR